MYTKFFWSMLQNRWLISTILAQKNIKLWIYIENENALSKLKLNFCEGEIQRVKKSRAHFNIEQNSHHRNTLGPHYTVRSN